DELATLRTRFEEAVGVLNASKGKSGRLNLYDLPWYLIIGPPGAGKTTALINSGLHFPLAERFGPEAIRGIGGTRDCDWWFTDDAVLIDTAGRYTTQDSDATVDQASWRGFLDLLKKYRKRRPINGILVAISVADLMTQSEQERFDHVRAVRARLSELEAHFGIRFPIYVMFTKCDLISGFTEYFDDLGRSERDQVWGATFPYSDDADTDIVSQFDREFDALSTRLNERMLERVNRETDPRRRILIHGFPKQVSLLKPQLGSFLKEVFAGNRYERTPLLRGFYLVSGTQEGTPVDRLLGSLSRTFGLEQGAVPQAAGGGKSFFITNLLSQVAFGEANLAGTNRNLERRLKLLSTGGYALVGIAVLAAAAAWLFSYQRVSGEIKQASTRAAQAKSLLAELSPRDLDPLAVVPALNEVRAMPGGYQDELEGSSRWQFGLGQDRKIGDIAQLSYRRLLEQAYLPRILLRLEGQLARGAASPDYTYEALKTYLMLDSKDHYDADSIRAFLEVDWIENLRREVTTEQRSALTAHLVALLERRVVPLPLPLDDTVISRARNEIRALPLADRIYGRLKRTMDSTGRGFNPREAAGGALADLVFTRKSGTPMSEPLPPMFTKSAYQKVFVSRSRETTNDVAAESWWILGEDEQLSPVKEESLLDAVRERYLDDFADSYANLLLDIDLVTFSDPDGAARVFNVLSREEDSPLLQLLNAIAAETRLDELGDDASITARVESGAAEAMRKVRDLIGTRSEQAQGLTDLIVSNDVGRRFARLNALVSGEEGATKPVDRLLQLFRDLYAYMSTIASEAAGGAIPPEVQRQGNQVLGDMKREAEQQDPMLVGALLGRSVERSRAITTGGLQAYINEQWASGPLQECRAAIAGRYPINTNSQQTIRLDDFGRYFGPGGTLDRFFREHLQDYVNVRSSPWRTRQTGNVPIRISGDALRSFEYADVVKRTFFRGASAQPAVAFDLRPLEMDTRLSQFLLDLEGKRVSYEFGPKETAYMQWPGPEPGSEIRLEMTDRQTGRTLMRRTQGPWAWFRLLDRSQMRATNISERFEVTFDVEGYTATYDLTASSAFNPFSLTQLREYRCPSRL
ncbi:MAG: type VI secretion system membrane subunit TssM, partial [Pseudomonadota bacterium]